MSIFLKMKVHFKAINRYKFILFDNLCTAMLYFLKLSTTHIIKILSVYKKDCSAKN